jgi:hypothetical protein
LKVNAATLSSWREVFLASGLSGLKSREVDGRDEKITQRQKALGETALNLEISREINRCMRGNTALWAPGKSNK